MIRKTIQEKEFELKWNEFPPLKFAPDSWISLDIEIFGMKGDRLHRPSGEFASIAFCQDPSVVWVISEMDLLQGVIDSFEDQNIITMNGSFDISHLRRWVKFPKTTKLWDIMHFDRILYNGFYDTFSLKDLVRRHLGIAMSKEARDQFENAEKLNDDMAKYNAMDARFQWLVCEKQRSIAKSKDLKVWYEIDMPALWVVLDMKGPLIDQNRWMEIAKNNKARSEILKADFPFNPNAPKQVLNYFKEQGAKLTKSADEEALSGIAEKFPEAQKVLDYRKSAKLASTYGEKWLEDVEDDGRIYPHYDINRAESGRMACISGATLLHTNRGSFRIDEYLPKLGDRIQTHTGNWKPIIRKLFKGLDQMYSVHLSNGNMLQCTGNHRILTPNGWKSLSELCLNSEVYSYVSIEEICSQSREYQKGLIPVSRRSSQIGNYGDCQGNIYDISECALDHSQLCQSGKEISREIFTNVESEKWSQEPDVWKEWFPTPSLQGIDFRWSWLFDEKGEREICFGRRSYTLAIQYSLHSGCLMLSQFTIAICQ